MLEPSDRTQQAARPRRSRYPVVMRLSRLYLWLIAACVLVGAFVLINSSFLPLVYVPGSEMFVAFCSIALAYAVVGLGCSAVYERGRARGFMISGMIVGLLAAIGWPALFLSPGWEDSFAAAMVLIWASIWSCLMMLIGLVLLLPMQSGWRRAVRASTIVMLAALGLFVACAFTFHPQPTSSQWSEADWQRSYEYERAAEQIGWSLALLTLGSLATTLIVGIAGALTGRTIPGTSPRVTYWLQCPRCGREQEALTGEHHCVDCRLRTRVELT